MSRGGSRCGAGRPASHAKTIQYLGLDVRQLHRSGRVWPGSSFTRIWTRNSEHTGTIGVNVPNVNSVHLNYRRNDEPMHVALKLERTACHFGGTRLWFNCPRCIRRVAIVYLASVPGCRRCLRLKYQSQSNDFLDRSWGRTQRILKKLGRDIDEFPKRPKGMRGSTYEHLYDAWCREEEFRSAALETFMAEHHNLFL